MSPADQTGDRARTAGTQETGRDTVASPAEPASGARANHSRLSLAAAMISAACAVWVVITTLMVIRAGYSPLPFWDEWNRWQSYLSYHYSPAWFFLQHNEHRLAVPDVLFAMDHLLFAARGWFLLACTFCLQGVMAVMLWRLSRRACPQDRSGAVVLGAAIVSCLYSAQQYTNFIWGFQVQFPLLYCGAAGSLLALWKADQERRRGGSVTKWFAVAAALAAVGTYSMANGILIWPVLFLIALWLGMPRRYAYAIAVAGVLIAIAYFHGWHRVNEPSNPLASIAEAEHVAMFWLTHLGSPLVPLASLFGNGVFATHCAVLLGAVLLLVLAAEFAMLWLFRDLHNGARAVAIHMGIFLAASSLLMAVGRSRMMALTDAATPRYLTAGYLFSLCVWIAAWPIGRRLSPRFLYSGTCLALLAGIAIHQTSALATVRNREADYHLGEVAVVDGVTDPEAWSLVYHTPKLALASVDYLRRNRLAIFAEEWTHWPGIALNRRFSIDSNPKACQGEIEGAMPVISPLNPGWRLSGWAWDAKAGRPPRYVVLSGDSVQVDGVALTVAPNDPELSALSPQYTGSPWIGYVGGEPRTVKAYILESDQRSLCAIGSRPLHRFGKEVAFQNAGSPLGGGAVQLTGLFTKDGYFPPTGRPPAEGLVLGSWSGADSNTGSVQLGPFRLDGRTQVVLPLVTGPANHGLSVLIRNAATREILAELSPPPARMEWWAWAPELPAGREISIDVVAEDKGSGWGEWLAVGWPHLLNQTPAGASAQPVGSSAAAYFLDYIGDVQNPSAQSEIHISAQKTVRFSGWAIDEPGKSAAGEVDLVIDQVTYKAHYGIERLDIAAHFNNPAYRNSGFEFTIAAGQLTKGLHTVSVRVHSRDLKMSQQGTALQFTID